MFEDVLEAVGGGEDSNLVCKTDHSPAAHARTGRMCLFCAAGVLTPSLECQECGTVHILLALGLNLRLRIFRAPLTSLGQGEYARHSQPSLHHV